MLIDHAAVAPAKKKYVRRLKEIRSFEVAFVPKGANGWDFLVVKEDSTMPAPLEVIAQALDTLTLAKQALLDGQAPTEVHKSVASAAMALLGRVDGPTVEFVSELKALNADLHTVATSCNDIGVVDAIDGLVARSGALMKMAQAAVEASKATPEPMPNKSLPLPLPTGKTIPEPMPASKAPPTESTPDDSRSSAGVPGMHAATAPTTPPTRSTDGMPGMKAKEPCEEEEEDEEPEENCKAGAPPAPLPPRTPGTAAAAATAEAPLTTQGSQQALEAEISVEEPKDMIEAEGDAGSEPDLSEKDAEASEVTDTDKALPSEGKPGGHKSPPKGYPKERSKYADPANYKYPLDTEAHVRAAMSYFSKPKNRASYGSAEVKAIWSRIVSAARKLGIKVQSPGKPGTDKCGASCNKGVHEEISVMANKEASTQTQTPQTEVNKGVQESTLVDLNVPAGGTPAPADKAGQTESPSGSGASLIGVAAAGASGAVHATSSLPSTTAQVPPQVTSASDILGTLKAEIGKLLEPVVKSITDMRAEFEAKLTEVHKSATGEAAVPSAATPGATATTPAPAAKAPETPAAGRPKVAWPSDFNEGTKPPEDTIND